MNDLDFQIFADCMTGPHAGPPATGCLRADLDTDGDVDLSDFALLQLELSL